MGLDLSDHCQISQAAQQHKIPRYPGIALLCAFSLLAHSNSKRHIKIIHFFHIEWYITLGKCQKKGTQTLESRAISGYLSTFKVIRLF